MNTSSNVSQSVKRCIDDHLDAIDDVLRNGGLSRSERQNILDDVEAQVHEMLVDRAPGEPRFEDARAVLAEMDSPESYGDEDRAAPTVAPEKKEGQFASGRLALRLSVGSLLAALLLVGFTALLLTYYRGYMAGDRFWPMFVSVSISITAFLLPCQIVAFILGVVAGSRPKGKAARILALASIGLYVILAATSNGAF